MTPTVLAGWQCAKCVWWGSVVQRVPRECVVRWLGQASASQAMRQGAKIMRGINEARALPQQQTSALQHNNETQEIQHCAA